MTGLTKVTAGVIAANAVVDSFGSQSITGDKIGLTAINANNIVTGAVTGDKLGATSINANNIVDSSITSAKIDTIANTQLTGTITSAQLGTGAVSNTKIASGAVEQYFADTGYQAQFRNRIINGDMRIDQRNAGAAVTASDAFPVDRFVMANSTDGAFSAQQDSSAPVGFINSTKVTTTTADGTLITTQQLSIRQIIEGTNISDLAWGTANAKTVTLSFWVRSSLTGTFGGAFRNSAVDRNYPFTYSISVADTWEYKTVTIPGDTSGTWLTTTGAGIRITFGLGVGPDSSGTAGAWAAGNIISATGAVSVIGTLNATWYITGVQLEVGSVATPFERRPFGTELSLCQRYYYKTFPNASGYVFSLAYVGNSTDFSPIGQFPVQLRAAPSALEQSGTASHYASNNGSGQIPCNSVPIFSSRTSQFAWQVNVTVASGITGGHATSFITNNAAAYLAWSAEL